MAYGYLGSMRTNPGQRAAVIEILLRGVDELRDVGCVQYTVAGSLDDAELIWVNEVWGSEHQHDASLELPQTKAAIAEAMPMLTGEFSSVRTEVFGGLGL